MKIHPLLLMGAEEFGRLSNKVFKEKTLFVRLV
jgi:hypothetical protein